MIKKTQTQDGGDATESKHGTCCTPYKGKQDKRRQLQKLNIIGKIISIQTYQKPEVVFN